MNKIIIVVMIVLGLLVSVGICEGKWEQDPRLKKGILQWISEGEYCHQDVIYFYERYVTLYKNVCVDALEHQEKGAWHTRNDTLFLHLCNASDDCVDIISKYSVDGTYFKSEKLGTFKKVPIK
jgi:hypothetical protein